MVLTPEQENKIYKMRLLIDSCRNNPDIEIKNCPAPDTYNTLLNEQYNLILGKSLPV